MRKILVYMKLTIILVCKILESKLDVKCFSPLATIE
jgi:hypothetical protein